MKSYFVKALFLLALALAFPMTINAENYEPAVLRKQILNDKQFKSGSFLVEVTCGGECSKDFYNAFYYKNSRPYSVNYISVTKEYLPRVDWKLEKRIDNKIIGWRQALHLRFAFLLRPRVFSSGCADGVSYNIHSKIFGMVFERYYDCAAMDAFNNGFLKIMTTILLGEAKTKE